MSDLASEKLKRLSALYETKHRLQELLVKYRYELAAAETDLRHYNSEAHKNVAPTESGRRSSVDHATHRIAASIAACTTSQLELSRIEIEIAATEQQISEMDAARAQREIDVLRLQIELAKTKNNNQ